MNGYSKTAGGFILALMIAVAFTGAVSPDPIGIKSDCIDGVDNDSDGNLDEMDDQCWEYPFADGAGEYQTTSGSNGKMFSSDSYEMSVFDWHNQVAPHYFMMGGQACFGQEALYQQIESESNGEDPSYSQWLNWRALNCN